MEWLASSIVTLFVSFFFGYLYGKSKEGKKRAENSVQSASNRIEEDASIDLSDNDNIARLRKKWNR